MTGLHIIGHRYRFKSSVLEGQENERRHDYRELYRHTSAFSLLCLKWSKISQIKWNPPKAPFILWAPVDHRVSFPRSTCGLMLAFSLFFLLSIFSFFPFLPSFLLFLFFAPYKCIDSCRKGSGAATSTQRCSMSPPNVPCWNLQPLWHPVRGHSKESWLVMATRRCKALNALLLLSALLIL